MDDAYYGLVQSGRRETDGLSSLSAETIIPIKAKAFLDLSERKNRGEKIDSSAIKKHRLDVFRLSVLLADKTWVALPDRVRADFQAFVKAMAPESVDTKALGIRNRTKDQILAALAAIYRL